MCRLSGREMLPIKPRGFLLGEGKGVGRVTVLTFLDYLCLKNQQERAIVYAFFFCSNRISLLILTAQVRSCCRCFSCFTLFANHAVFNFPVALS